MVCGLRSHVYSFGNVRLLNSHLATIFRIKVLHLSLQKSIQICCVSTPINHYTRGQLWQALSKNALKILFRLISCMEFDIAFFAISYNLVNFVWNIFKTTVWLSIIEKRSIEKKSFYLNATVKKELQKVKRHHKQATESSITQGLKINLHIHKMSRNRDIQEKNVTPKILKWVNRYFLFIFLQDSNWTNTNVLFRRTLMLIYIVINISGLSLITKALFERKSKKNLIYDDFSCSYDKITKTNEN